MAVGRLGAVLIASLVVAACAGTGTTVPADRRFGQTPAYGVRTVVPPGGTVFSQSIYESRPGARLATPLSADVLLQRVRVPADEDLVGTAFDGRTWFCTGGAGLYSLLGLPLGPVCLHDDDQDGRFDTAAAPGDPLVRGPVGPVAYRRTDRAGGARYGQEIVYDGTFGDEVRLRYRETGADGARRAEEAFAVARPDPAGTEVRFRSFRMTVHAASADRLEATILSGF